MTIGEAMGLFIADEVGNLEDVTKYTRSIAGAELNVSVGLARLNHDVSYATKVGNDPIGKSIIHFIKKEKIDAELVYECNQYLTGFLMKEKTENGDPYVASYRKGSAASKLRLEDFAEVNFSKYGYIHLTGIFLGVSPDTKKVSHYFADEAKKHGAVVTFDPNLRPNLWASEAEMVTNINELAAKADVVLPGISEGKILTGFDQPEDIADYYLDRHAKIVVIKLGEKGAYIKGENLAGKYVPSFKVEKIIDTVGAGDGFAVGVISGLVEGLPVEEAVLRGNAIGAIQLLSPSDNEGLPTREELDRFIQTQVHS